MHFAEDILKWIVLDKISLIILNSVNWIPGRRQTIVWNIDTQTTDAYLLH